MESGESSGEFMESGELSGEFMESGELSGEFLGRNTVERAIKTEIDTRIE